MAFISEENLSHGLLKHSLVIFFSIIWSLEGGSHELSSLSTYLSLLLISILIYNFPFSPSLQTYVVRNMGESIFGKFHRKPIYSILSQ
jgi:hypothetical protein